MENSKLFTRTFEDLVILFLSDATQVERRRGRRLAQRLTPLVSALCNTPALVALRDMNQQGFAPMSFHRTVQRAPVPYSQIPREHNRWHHSRYVAAISTAIAARWRLSWDDTRALVAAALCHDVGHVALGHNMEYALRAVDTTWHHEAHTAYIVETDPFVQTAFDTVDVATTAVLNIIAEHGRLGAIQCVSDTAAYCFVDTLVTGFFGSCDEEPILRTIAGYISSVSNVTDDGLFVVSVPDAVRGVLSLRALLYADRYLAIESARCAVALQTLVRHACAVEPLTPQTHAWLESDLQAYAFLSQVIDETTAGDDRKRMRSMLDFPETDGMAYWRTHSFECAEELHVWYANHSPQESSHMLMCERAATELTVKTVDAIVRGDRVCLRPHERDIVTPNAPPAVAYEWMGLTH